MLSRAANIAVPIWRGTYCFLWCFFLCTCSVSAPFPPRFLPASIAVLMLSCPTAHSASLLPHLAFLWPTKWIWWENIFGKGLWNLGLMLRERRRMMNGLSLLLLVSPVPQTTLIRDSGGKVRLKVLPLGSSSFGINHPWQNSCCTTKPLWLGGKSPLVTRRDHFPQ